MHMLKLEEGAKSPSACQLAPLLACEPGRPTLVSFRTRLPVASQQEMHIKSASGRGGWASPPRCELRGQAMHH